MHVKVLVPEESTWVGFKLQPTPAGVETASVMVPVKPFCDVTAIMTFPEPPAMKLRYATLVAREA